MHTRLLGTSDLRITPMGLGTGAIGGGGYAFGWGPQDDTQSIATIHRAVDAGINWIDTAGVYGLGRAERVIARALRELPASRRPCVFTKCSLAWDDAGAITHRLDGPFLRRQVEESLQRLNVEALDLCQIHWPALPPGAPASPTLEEGWAALADLRREGKVRAIGVSNFSVSQIDRISPIAVPVSLQPPYSLLRHGAETELFPQCEARQIGVLVYSPMESGLLSGTMTRERVARLPDDDWRRGSADFKEPRLTANLALVERLRPIGGRYGRSPGEVAIAWTLRHPAVTGVIAGARSPAQIGALIGAAQWRIPAEETSEIERALAGAES